jgi:gas vesicle protein
MIPVYTAKKVNVTDLKGNQLKNEDGTPITRVFLVDQFGNIRSAEAVKEQHKKINKAIGRILLKVGGGAALGVAGGLLASKGKASGGVIGGVAGAAAGLALSAKDIKQAKAQKKSLKQQEELIAKYQENFTSEGTPVNASVDVSKIEGLDIREGVSMTAEALKTELQSESFNSSDESAWTI